MPYDAFISYCSEDKKIADAVCGTLEANKIRCWIAPRDVGPGRTRSSAIVIAIRESAVMVVIFSKHSNASPQVLREIYEIELLRDLGGRILSAHGINAKPTITTRVAFGAKNFSGF
jgi:hypothetical protein